MRRSTSRRPLLVVAILAVGGILLLEQPYLTAAVGAAAIAQVGAPTSPLPTPTQSAPSPLRLPTLTPKPPRLPTATPEPYSPVTLVPTELLRCARQGDEFACHDQLLVMEFRYSTLFSEFGFAQLQRGSYAGFYYRYRFADSQSWAGGLSSDYADGSDRMFLEGEKGFAGQPPAAICVRQPETLCQVISPGAMVMVLLPQPEQLCTRGPGFYEIPYGVVVLDLTEHPLINGFTFSFPLLSPGLEAAFREQRYSYGWQQAETECKPLERAFRYYIETLRADLPAGTAPTEIQQRYDALFDLAKSIQSPYIASTLQSP